MSKNSAGLSVVVSADIDVSVKQLSTDFKSISAKLSSAKIPTIAIGIDVAKTQANFEKQLQNIANKIQINANVTPNVSKNINTTVPTVSTRKMSQATAILTEEKRANLALQNAEEARHKQSMNNAKERIELAKIEAEEIKARKISQTAEILAEEKRANLVLQNAEEVRHKQSINNAKERMQLAKTEAAEIKARISAEKIIEKDVTNIQSKIDLIDQYANKLEILQSKSTNNNIKMPDISGITTLIEKLKGVEVTSGNYKEVANQLRVLDNEYKKVIVSVQSLNQVHSSDKAIEQRIGKIEKLRSQLETLYRTNKKLQDNDQATQQYKDMISQLDTSIDMPQADVSKLTEQVNALGQGWKEAGLLTETFGDKIKSAYEKFGGWMLITRSFMTIIQLFKQMIQNVKDLDVAMTELRKVTNESENSYNKFLQTAIQKSKELGATLVDVVTSTADYARLGYSIPDATALAEASILYKNVGDGIENISDASASIISTMKAFGIEASKASTIVDKFNEVGNNFAISSKGIGDALLRSASALSAAGNTIDESIGLIVAMNNVMQDPDVVGTTAKTISMRLRNTAGELEELGEDAQGAAESVTKLQTQLLNLTSGRVNIMADADTFKSTYQIMTELSQVWSSLTDKMQADVTRLVAGVRQGNAFTALMENMAEGAQAVGTSINSAGSAIAENEKYLDSIAGKTAKLTATFQELSTKVVDSSAIKFVIDLGIGLLEVLNAIQDLNILLPGIVTTIAIIKALKMVDDISKMASMIGTATKITDQMITSVALLNNTQKLLLKTILESTLGKESEIVATLGLSAAEKTLTGTNLGLATSFKALMAAIPVWGWITLAITALVGVISAVINGVNKSRQAMIDHANEVSDSYKTAQDTYKSSLNTLTGLQSEFEKLSKGVDENGKNVSLTADQYSRYLDIVNQIVSISPSVCNGYDAEGRAIVDYKNVLEEAIATQNTYMQNQKNMYLGSGKDIFDGTIAEYKKAQKEMKLTWDNKISSAIYGSYTSIDSYDAASIVDERAKLYKEALESVNIDTSKWLNDADMLTSVYENHDKIITLLKNTGKWSENEINNISTSILGLAGSYTELNVIQNKQVEYLKTWTSEQEWYSKIPAEALLEFHKGLETVNNPLKDFAKNTESADIYARAFVQSISSDAVSEIIKLSKGLSNGTVSLEEYNTAVDDFKNKNKDGLISKEATDSVVKYLEKFSNSAVVISEVGNNFKDVSKNIGEYNEKVRLLNQLFAEQELNGKISAETYDYIRENFADLTDVIEAQYDVLGNFDGWQLNTKEAEKYADTQKELAVEVLNANSATAKQVSQLLAYQGQLGSTSERVKDICDDIDTLSSAYAKSADGTKFTAKEMTVLKDQFPDLIFQLKETTDELGNVTTGYELNGKSALDLIDDNYKLIGSVKELKLQWIQLTTALKIQDFGKSASVAQQHVNAISNYIVEQGITSLEEYLKSIEKAEDEVAEWVVTFVAEFLDAMRIIATEAEDLQGLSGSAANNALSDNKKSSKDEDTWKKAFEIQQKELEYAKNKNLITETEYYDQSKALYEKYFGEKLRATIADSDKKQEYLDMWRSFDVEYYNFLNNLQESSIDEYIKYSENLYKVHQNEEKYINDLTWALNRYKDVLTDTQKEDITKKIAEAHLGYYDNLITDIEHQIYLLGREINTEKERIALYEEAQKILLDKKQYYLELGYDSTSNELQEIEKLYNGFADNIVDIVEKAYDDIVKAQKKATEEAIDQLELEEKALDDVLDAVVDHLKRQKQAEIDALNDNIDQIKDSYDEAKKNTSDYYDGLIDSAKKSYNEQKKAQKQYYDDLIKNTKKSISEQEKAQKQYYDDLIKNTKKSFKEQEDAQKQYYDNLIDSAKKSRDAQVKGLEDLLDQYKELINAKKESLQATKDEEEYNKNIANKNKNISSLQSQIDALQFDDSGSARAQRLKLEEELAKAQEDLGEYQADYALDKQLKALDKEYEAYEKMMKEKIELIKEETEIAVENFEKQKEEHMKMLEAQHEAYIESLEKQRDAHMEALELENERRLEAIELQRDAHMEAIELENERRIESIEMQKDAALKAMEDEYNAQVATLESQIENIKEYLKQEGNLRRDANELLRQEGQALWDELMAYEYEYSKDIEGLQNSWAIANGAMDKYNDSQMNVLQTLKQVVATLQEYNNQLTILNNASVSTLTSNMKANSKGWANATTDAERNTYHQANIQLAQDYNNAVGKNALRYNEPEGRWYLDDVPLYHEGAKKGFVLQNKFPVLKSDEMLAKLAANELVITPPQLRTIAKTMFSIGAMTPQSSGNSGYNIEKLLELNIENVNETSLDDLKDTIDNAVDRGINKLQDAHKRIGVVPSARKMSI